MRRSLTSGYDLFHLAPFRSPAMTAQSQIRHSGHRWIRKALPCSVVVLVVGSLGTFLFHAVENARNAARSATTT
jgi:hypothetical protein